MLFNNNSQNMNYDQFVDQVPYRAPSYYNNGYIAGVNNEVPEPAVGNITEGMLYPDQYSSDIPVVPYENTAVNNGYAHGGRIRRFKKGGLLGNPGKWFKSIAGGGAGAIIGNMIMPGVGGVIGGALGNALGEGLRGRKNYGEQPSKGPA